MLKNLQFLPMMFKHEAFFWGKKPWWFVSVENPWWFSEVTHEESLSASTPSKGQFLEWFQGENSADLSCFFTWYHLALAIPTQEFSWVRLSWFWAAEHLKISEDIWRFQWFQHIPSTAYTSMAFSFPDGIMKSLGQFHVASWEPCCQV